MVRMGLLLRAGVGVMVSPLTLINQGIIKKPCIIIVNLCLG